MAEMQWTAKQIGAIQTELHTERADHNVRMKVRRQLIEMSSEAQYDDRTGTHIPSP